MCNPLDFSNKRILVTGASSGIGREIAVYLSRLGASLILTGRKNDALKETEVLLADRNRCELIIGDLTSSTFIEELIKESVKDGKKLDGLVYVPGIYPLIPLRMITKDKMQDFFNINYFPFIEIVKYFSKIGAERRSSIVAISSIAAVAPEKCQTIYSATKAAINASVQALALELVSKNININSIMPGAVKTDNFSDEEIAELSSKQILGVLTPEDVAGMCAFLLSDMTKCVTGRNFYCDAGRF